jgi:hypothetical protein
VTGGSLDNVAPALRSWLGVGGEGWKGSWCTKEEHRGAGMVLQWQSGRGPVFFHGHKLLDLCFGVGEAQCLEPKIWIVPSL